MVKEVGAGRGAASPVAQYHNGHLVNRVDIGGQHRWEGEQAGGQRSTREEMPRSASSHGLAPVEDSKLVSGGQLGRVVDSVRSIFPPGLLLQAQ